MVVEGWATKLDKDGTNWEPSECKRKFLRLDGHKLRYSRAPPAPGKPGRKASKPSDSRSVDLQRVLKLRTSVVVGAPAGAVDILVKERTFTFAPDDPHIWHRALAEAVPAPMIEHSLLDSLWNGDPLTTGQGCSARSSQAPAQIADEGEVEEDDPRLSTDVPEGGVPLSSISAETLKAREAAAAKDSPMSKAGSQALRRARRTSKASHPEAASEAAPGTAFGTAPPPRAGQAMTGVDGLSPSELIERVARLEVANRLLQAELDARDAQLVEAEAHLTELQNSAAAELRQLADEAQEELKREAEARRALESRVRDLEEELAVGGGGVAQEEEEEEEDEDEEDDDDDDDDDDDEAAGRPVGKSSDEFAWGDPSERASGGFVRTPRPSEQQKKAGTPAYGGGDTCSKCGRVCYAAEKLVANGCILHPECFRCAHCNVKLASKRWEVDPNGIYYCQVRRHHPMRPCEPPHPAIAPRLAVPRHWLRDTSHPHSPTSTSDCLWAGCEWRTCQTGRWYGRRWRKCPFLRRNYSSSSTPSCRLQRTNCTKTGPGSETETGSQVSLARAIGAATALYLGARSWLCCVDPLQILLGSCSGTLGFYFTLASARDRAQTAERSGVGPM